MFQLFSISDLPKKGQGTPKVTISTILIVLKCLKLHTKFQGHRSFGFGEEDLFKVLEFRMTVLLFFANLF